MRSLNIANRESLTIWRRSRSLAAAVCLMAFTGLTATQFSNAQGGAVAPRIEGTWLVTVTPAGGVPPPFPSLVTYSAGGGMVVTDSSFPPAQGNVYQGTWVRKGNQFEFTFLGFQYDSAGVHSGYVRVFETVTLEQSGDAYNGAGTFQLLDLNQNVVFSEGDTTHATRINAQ